MRALGFGFRHSLPPAPSRQEGERQWPCVLNSTDPPIGAESTGYGHGHNLATPPVSGQLAWTLCSPPTPGRTQPLPSPLPGLIKVQQNDPCRKAACAGGRGGPTSWSWFWSPTRIERLARDSTAVIPYRLMRTLATRFKTSCSSTMVWEQRAGGETYHRDTAPTRSLSLSLPGPPLRISEPHSTPWGSRPNTAFPSGFPLALSRSGQESRQDHVPEAWLRPPASAYYHLWTQETQIGS